MVSGDLKLPVWKYGLRYRSSGKLLAYASFILCLKYSASKILSYQQLVYAVMLQRIHGTHISNLASVRLSREIS